MVDVRAAKCNAIGEILNAIAGSLRPISPTSSGSTCTSGSRRSTLSYRDWKRASENRQYLRKREGQQGPVAVINGAFLQAKPDTCPGQIAWHFDREELI